MWNVIPVEWNVTVYIMEGECQPGDQVTTLKLSGPLPNLNLYKYYSRYHAIGPKGSE